MSSEEVRHVCSDLWSIYEHLADLAHDVFYESADVDIVNHLKRRHKEANDLYEKLMRMVDQEKSKGGQ